MGRPWWIALPSLQVPKAATSLPPQLKSPRQRAPRNVDLPAWRAEGTLSTCVYTPGRRLVLAYRQQAWFEPPVEPIMGIMHGEFDGYPFR